MENRRSPPGPFSLDTKGMPPEPERPWQIMATGEDLSSMDWPTLSRLSRIFDIMPGVSFLTVETTAGPVHVSRDFPSGMSDDIDGLLKAVYDNNPQVAAITFPENLDRPARRTTPDRPSLFDRSADGPGQDV